VGIPQRSIAFKYMLATTQKLPLSLSGPAVVNGGYQLSCPVRFARPPFQIPFLRPGYRDNGNHGQNLPEQSQRPRYDGSSM
jgi:hypothetical protein